MPQLPWIVVWVSVLCGYLPYQMGYAFLNPLVIVGYGFLGLWVGGVVREPLWAIAATLGTSWVALLVVNLLGGAPAWVLPPWGIVLVNAWLGGTGALLAQRLRPNVARAVFACFVIFVYFNANLPESWKIWIAEHTTDQDLMIFGGVCGSVFVGTWRLRR
ncbi:hypothetical protein [Bryobacter aggregatus]|uniref:hypothetical protein n=1 Tax=Bryobacter aggregatus TaxID=360054 RepID=UPI0004E1DC6E|nr:hypothetical protein [Bryobacter aggregatus]